MRSSNSREETTSALMRHHGIDAEAEMTDEEVRLGLKQYGMELLTEIPEAWKLLGLGRQRSVWSSMVEWLHLISKPTENLLPQPGKLRALAALLLVCTVGVVTLRLVPPVLSIDPIVIPAPGASSLTYEKIEWSMASQSQIRNEKPASVGGERPSTELVNGRDVVQTFILVPSITDNLGETQLSNLEPGIFTVYDGSTLTHGEYPFRITGNDYRRFGSLNVSHGQFSFSADAKDPVVLFLSADDLTLRSLTTVPLLHLRSVPVVMNVHFEGGNHLDVGLPEFRPSTASLDESVGRFIIYNSKMSQEEFTSSRLYGSYDRDIGKLVGVSHGLSYRWYSVQPQSLSGSNTGHGGIGSSEPLFFRGNSDDIIEYWHTNLVPNYYLIDDFQVRTPTAILGQHIHLVKFDVTSSDGAGNGFSYESGTFSPDEVREVIHGINAPGSGGWVTFSDSRLAKYVDIPDGGYILNRIPRSMGTTLLRLDLLDELIVHFAFNFPFDENYHPIAEPSSAQHLTRRSSKAFQSDISIYPRRWLGLGSPYRPETQSEETHRSLNDFNEPVEEITNGNVMGRVGFPALRERLHQKELPVRGWGND